MYIIYMWYVFYIKSGTVGIAKTILPEFLHKILLDETQHKTTILVMNLIHPSI